MPRLTFALPLLLTLSPILPLLAPAAPRPAHRPKALPAVTPGEYALTWGGSEGVAQLAKDGAWACDWLGCRWEGRWSFDPKTRVFSVVETAFSPGGEPNTIEWAGELDGALKGVTKAGTAFGLARREAGRPVKPDF